jgi:hypothetical protein
VRALSGQKTSSYTVFIYTRKIIFREEVAPDRPRELRENTATEEISGTGSDREGSDRSE